jgi:hypothetical protein
MTGAWGPGARHRKQMLLAGQYLVRAQAGEDCRRRRRCQRYGAQRYRPGEIQCLSADLGPAAIAKQLGVARSTVYRLLGKAVPLG